MQPQTEKESPLHFLSHPSWAGISGIVGILALLWAIVTFVPQAAPVRAGIHQMISGTPAPTATPTSTPTPPPSLAPAETLPENIVLKCNECDDPVVTTITSIKVEPQNNRMIWSLTLFNNSQSSVYCYFQKFSLQDSIDDNSFDSTGDIRDVTICMTLQPLYAGETRTTTVTFSFTPYAKVTYTLSANLYEGSTSGIQFLPVPLTF